MFSQQLHHQTFTTLHPAADELYLACDCLGWFPMAATGEGYWRVSLALPAGRHHVRYYARWGSTTLLYAQEDVTVGPAPARPAAGQPERGLATAESGRDRDDAVRYE